jgi:hypothetical protein
MSRDARCETPRWMTADRHAEARWLHLTRDEADFLWAAMSRLVPGDASSPSAAERGGVVALDRRLAADGGQVGSQGLAALDPREFYRRGIAALQARLDREAGTPFQGLPPERQAAVIESLAKARSAGGRGDGEDRVLAMGVPGPVGPPVDLDGIPGAAFLERLRSDAMAVGREKDAAASPGAGAVQRPGAASRGVR